MVASNTSFRKLEFTCGGMANTQERRAYDKAGHPRIIAPFERQWPDPSMSA